MSRLEKCDCPERVGADPAGGIAEFDAFPQGRDPVIGQPQCCDAGTEAMKQGQVRRPEVPRNAQTALGHPDTHGDFGCSADGR